MHVTLRAARSPFCLWLCRGRGRLRLGKEPETAPLVLWCCLLPEPGVRVTLRSDPRLEAEQEPRLPDEGSWSIAQETWSSVQAVRPRCTCGLLAVYLPAPLPAGCWTALKELADGPAYISRLCCLLEAYLLSLYFHFPGSHTTFWLFMSCLLFSHKTRRTLNVDWRTQASYMGIHIHQRR